MKTVFYRSCSLCFLSLIGQFALAQNTGAHYWLGVGLGATQQPSGMMALGYEFANKPTLLITRYTDNRELFSDRQPSENVKELGLLYGIRKGKFRFSSGVSGVWGTKRGAYLSSDADPLFYGSHYYESLSYATIGIPGEIRFLTSNEDVGIGLTAFGNLNAKRSFAGINLSVYIGQMKK